MFRWWGWVRTRNRRRPDTPLWTSHKNKRREEVCLGVPPIHPPKTRCGRGFGAGEHVKGSPPIPLEIFPTCTNETRGNADRHVHILQASNPSSGSQTFDQWGSRFSRRTCLVVFPFFAWFSFVQTRKYGCNSHERSDVSSKLDEKTARTKRKFSSSFGFDPEGRG